MTVQTDPYTFTNGTVANALEVNARFNLLYTLQNGGIDGTNVNLAATNFAWTAPHTWVSTTTTGTVLSITGSSLTSGGLGLFYSNSADTSSRSLVYILNDNAAATGAVCLRLRQDSTGNIITAIGASSATVFALAYNGDMTFSGTISGTYTIGGTPTITGASAIYAGASSASTLTGTIESKVTAAGGAAFVAIGTNAGAEGPRFYFYHDSSSPAANDIIGSLLFYGKDSETNVENYGSLYVVIDDPTSGSEDSHYQISTKLAGLLSSGLSIYGDRIFSTGGVFGSQSQSKSTAIGATLEVNSSSSGPDLFSAITTNAGTNGPIISTFHDSASPAANDQIGYFRAYGRDSAANLEVYSDIYTVIDDTTSGSEDSHVVIRPIMGGSNTEGVSVYGSGILLPDTDPPTANYINRNSGVKAWLNMASSGSETSDYNIDAASSGKTSTGTYDVYFDTDFSSSSSYAITCTVPGVIGALYQRVQASPATSGKCTVNVYNNNASLTTKEDGEFYLIAVGDQ